MGGIPSSSSRGEYVRVLEEEGVLLCCLYVLDPSALLPAATAEKVGPNEASILLPLLESAGGVEGLLGMDAVAAAAAPPEYRL